MKTLTVTTARANLGYWVKRAISGEEIAIVHGAEIVALRRVPIEAADYAEREYGLTSKQMAAAAKRIHGETKKILERGDHASGDAFIRELRGSSRKSRKKVSKKAVTR